LRIVPKEIPPSVDVPRVPPSSGNFTNPALDRALVGFDSKVLAPWRTSSPSDSLRELRSESTALPVVAGNREGPFSRRPGAKRCMIGEGRIRPKEAVTRR
jgi:hypothetical protein